MTVGVLIISFYQDQGMLVSQLCGLAVQRKGWAGGDGFAAWCCTVS
jgi:hypothetical protein